MATGRDPDHDRPKNMNLYAQGSLLPDELVSCTDALNELGLAFEDMQGCHRVQVVLGPGGRT